jgi:hypothetical protein
MTIIRRPRPQQLKIWMIPFVAEVTVNKQIRQYKTNLMYVCPCIIYEIDERYPLDATIYLLL